VGYTGGSTKNPTYHDLADHTETVQFDFDPAKVSYEELVARFFAVHDATRSSSRRQYMSAIFTHDAEQERVARSIMARVQEKSNGAIRTLIVPLTDFYLAEDYHQKYALQGDRILSREFRGMFPDIWDLVDSSAATRVNAYLYGCGSAELLSTELDSLGLSDAGRARLQTGSPVGACSVK
jgi:peptide-methionine (S)-S-oxide reductase